MEYLTGRCGAHGARPWRERPIGAFERDAIMGGFLHRLEILPRPAFAFAFCLLSCAFCLLPSVRIRPTSTLAPRRLSLMAKKKKAAKKSTAKGKKKAPAKKKLSVAVKKRKKHLTAMFEHHV